MEYISIWILRICVFVYATELQNVQLLSVPDPCPDIAHSITIADMCTTDFASEDSNTGGTTVDSVALRAITQKDGCECEVSLKNQNNKYTIYTRKYDLLLTAAPENQSCGLSIDIDYQSSINFPADKTPIECTKGTIVRSYTLLRNGVLNLRSRITGGKFSRGYCIQIYRHHTSVDRVGIIINCSLPYMQTTQQDKTGSSNIQTTQRMIDATINDMIVSDTDSTLYIAIGVGSSVVVIALFVVVAIIINRRKGKKHNEVIEVQPDIDSNDDDSDGLKYNALYNASEQQDIMEGDYHTVDIQGKQNRTGIQNFGSDYSAVDGDYSSVDIIDKPAKDGFKTDNRIKSSSTTKPRSESQRTEEETSAYLKHVTAGSNVEYAVVDKRGRTEQNIKHVTSPNDSNVEYAVIDKH